MPWSAACEFSAVGAGCGNARLCRQALRSDPKSRCGGFLSPCAKVADLALLSAILAVGPPWPPFFHHRFWGAPLQHLVPAAGGRRKGLVYPPPLAPPYFRRSQPPRCDAGPLRCASGVFYQAGGVTQRYAAQTHKRHVGPAAAVNECVSRAGPAEREEKRRERNHIIETGKNDTGTSTPDGREGTGGGGRRRCGPHNGAHRPRLLRFLAPPFQAARDAGSAALLGALGIALEALLPHINAHLLGRGEGGAWQQTASGAAFDELATGAPSHHPASNHHCSPSTLFPQQPTPPAPLAAPPRTMGSPRSADTSARMAGSL